MPWPAGAAPLCWPHTARPHCPGEHCIAVPEATWQACGHLQHTLLHQVPTKTVPAGPAGCGKSTVLMVLADSLGFELCTWEAPTPLLWQEHLHQVCCLHMRQQWQVWVSTCEQCAPRLISERTVACTSD